MSSLHNLVWSLMSRRELLRQGVHGALAGGGALAGCAGSALDSGIATAQELTSTPACADGDDPTPRQMDGPFYKPKSPERVDLVEPGAKARVVEFSGYVLTRGCKPLPGVLVDLWHADDAGEYDTRGFRYRGHILTDADGRYRFRTIVPALYPGRTRHYHVKVFATGRPLLTTQLYFPNEPRNARDGLYRRDLEMVIAAAGEGKGDAQSARFDFVLDMR